MPHDEHEDEGEEETGEGPCRERSGCVRLNSTHRVRGEW